MTQDKPVTPSEMGKKSRQNLRENMSKEELSEYYRAMATKSWSGKRKPKNPEVASKYL